VECNQDLPEMNFRDFLNMFDFRNMPASADAPQKKQAVGQNAIDYVPQANDTPQAVTTDYSASQQQKHALSPLVNAMKKLDPFIRAPGIVSFSGTPDFASPEQARGQGKERDNVTHLYVSFARTRPQLAAMLKPVVTAYKQFENDFLELCGELSVPLEWRENQYLASKIDRILISDIGKGIQAFSTTIQQIPIQAVQPAQQKWQKMQQSFQNFAASFNAIQQKLLQQVPQVPSPGW
jgi:hypothetical protein